jgi:amphi-Trp domain-containing protein
MHHLMGSAAKESNELSAIDNGCSGLLKLEVTIGAAMALELKEKSTMSREAAAGRLHEIADELASGNDIIMERGQARFVAKVPVEVAMKIEFEVEDDETEFEIELTW